LKEHKKNKKDIFYDLDNNEISNVEEDLVLKLQDDFLEFRKNIKDIKTRIFLHRFTNLMLKYFKKNPILLSNKAGLFAIVEDDEQALKYFLKAYKYNKRDPVILFNIGATYSNLKQYKKAIKFYSKIALVTNDKNKVDEANDSINKIRLIAN
jgi:tetratricopeptide (TPR) repeat protein